MTIKQVIDEIINVRDDLAFNMDDDLSEIEFAAVAKELYETIFVLEQIAKNNDFIKK